ncbi:hypothetical protein HYPSUDRAFT_830333 [Hypholoma sublateritium FD-334 SS-4]|uniref:F-box domain-containing protein n=1 Tax=Hypholoma sublateritium (strain FD-334 SS-4) TaxID=945553 RepID=A0A0D2L0D6_HYPSF|nr:hypothetical protein HYPSUDRAFT_830333 [Hypholoma sublateritium FD-334 SS-4]
MGEPYRGIPRELIQHIFDILYVEDRDALKSCSYVDHLFTTLAQMRLLRSVNLAQSWELTGFPPPAGLLQILDESPHIAAYIWGLTIERTWPWQEPEPHDTHWLEMPNALSTLLPRLANIRRISVIEIKDDRIQSPVSPLLSWSRVGQSLELVFSPIHVHMLTELDLRVIDVLPVEVLRHCISLKRLSVVALSFDPSMAPSERSSPRAQLEYFHLEISTNMATLAQWFTHPSFPINITRLRTLSVRPGLRQKFEPLVSLAPCAAAATHLHIRAHDIPG